MSWCKEAEEKLLYTWKFVDDLRKQVRSRDQKISRLENQLKQAKQSPKGGKRKPGNSKTRQTEAQEDVIDDDPVTFDNGNQSTSKGNKRKACTDCLSKGLGIVYHKDGVCNKHHQKLAIEKAKKKNTPAYWQKLGIHSNKRGRKYPLKTTPTTTVAGALRLISIRSRGSVPTIKKKHACAAGRAPFKNYLG